MKLTTMILTILLTTTLSFAENPKSEAEPAKETIKKQKVVFDCSSANKEYIATRLWLIDATLQELVDNNVSYDAVLTIHSGCTDIVSTKTIEKDKQMEKVEKMLKKVSKHENLSIEACQIALNRFKIKDDELFPFVKTVHNSITRVIVLQNDGYAFIPFSK